MERRERLVNVGVLAWGLLAAIWLGRVFLLNPVDRIHINNEGLVGTIQLLHRLPA